MDTLKNIWRTAKEEVFKKRGLSFYFIVAATLFVLATIITYAVTGVTAFTPVLSTKVVALFCVAFVFTALFSVFEIKLGKYLAYLFCLWAWLEFIISEMPYISNVIVAIDGNSFSATFIVTVLFGLLAWASVLISAILQKKEIGSAKDKSVETVSVGAEA